MSAEWGRKCDYALVISIVPDVCWTPVNGVMVAVAYTIIGRVDNAIDTDPKYLICGNPALTTKSRIPSVEGNEAGTGGGIISGVNCGWCRPIEHSTTFKSSGNWLVREGDLFAMNCAGPDGPANTYGRLVILNQVAVAPSVTIASETKSVVDPATGKTIVETFESTMNPDTGATTTVRERSAFDPKTGHTETQRVEVTTHPNGRKSYKASAGAFDPDTDAFMWKTSSGDLPNDANVDMDEIALNDHGRLYLHEDDESYVPSPKLDDYDDIPDDDPDILNDPDVIAAKEGEAACRGEIEDAKSRLAWEGLKAAVDIGGIVDPTPATDIVGAGMALSDGEWLDAGLSVVSAVIPYGGDAVAKGFKGARAAKRIGKLERWIQKLDKLLAKWQHSIKEATKKAKIKKKKAASPSSLPKQPKNPGDGGFAPGGNKGGGGSGGPNGPKARKPHQPDAEKWTKKGGTIKENPDGTTTYRRKDGVEVTYDKDGFPDFSKHRHPEVKDVEIEFSGDYKIDKARANAIAKPKKEYLDTYTWHHHQDGKTMQLIRSDVHSEFFHTGGMATVK